MVDALNITAEAATGIIVELGHIGKWLQALGLLVIIWIGFQIFLLVINWQRFRTLQAVKEDLKRIEGKLNRLSRK